MGSEDHEEAEVIEAANILCFMKQTKLDSKAARLVQELKDKYLHINPTKQASTDQSFTTSTSMESQDKNRHQEITKEPRDEFHTKNYSNKTNKRIEIIKSESDITQLPAFPQPSAIPRLPPIEELQGLLGRCSEPFARELTKTDVDSSQTRLTIKTSNYKEFVRPLLNREDDSNDGINVTTYDENGKEYAMKLKFWSNKYYVLTTAGWKQFCQDHNLEKADVITIWMFRHLRDHNLCCAIICNKNW